jgi:UDP-2,3-diacylglucosamine pyrophosphatase LpxH
MEDRKVNEAALIVSDYHLSAGAVFPDGKPNPREDFRADAAYERMLEKHAEKYDDGKTVVTLVFDGDMIDFHAIRYRGRFGATRTVEEALEKLETNLRGHRRFWKATRDFLAKPRRRLVFISGNHDFELCAEEVQTRLREYLEIPTADDRVVFSDELQLGDVLIVHGDQFDELNANPPPDQRFITERSWGGKVVLFNALIVLATMGTALGTVSRRDLTPWTVALTLACGLALMTLFDRLSMKFMFTVKGKGRRFYNMPFGTVFNAWLGMRLKRFQPWIGRLQDHGAVWLLSFAHDWRFALLAFPLVIVAIFYLKLVVDVIDWRRKATIWTTLKLIGSTMSGDKFEKQLLKFLELRKDVRVIIVGHVHKVAVRNFHLSDGREVIYYNDGTGIEQVRVHLPEVVCTTRFVRTETFLRRVAYHWRHKPVLAVVFTLFHAAMAALPFGLAALFGWQTGVPGWIFAGLMVVMLPLRQAHALYRGESFTELTPVVVRVLDDGSTVTKLKRYDTKTDEFSSYL